MKYFEYFIKCLIRNFARMIFKPKFFLIIVIIISLIFLLNYESLAVYEGDDSYTDKNNTIFLSYDSICNDFLVRLNQNISTELGTEVINRLKNSQFSYYIYYGNLDGSSLISSSTFVTRNLHIYFWRNNNTNAEATTYDNWQGLDTSIYRVSGTGYTYSFNGSDLIKENDFSPCYIPNVLIGYESAAITNYITNSSKEETSSVIAAIESSSDKIEDTMTSTDYDESSVSIDSSSVDSVDDSSSTQLFTTVFTNFSNLLDSTNWNAVEQIEIGIPFVEEKIILKSDILSKIVGNSFLSTLITVSWYSLFGLYGFRYVTHIYHSVKSGDILNGLSLKDEVITSTML